MREGTETHSQSLCRESLNWRSLLGPSCQNSGNPLEEGRKYCGSQRGWRTPGEHGQLNQLSRAHTGSRRLKRQSSSIVEFPFGMKERRSCVSRGFSVFPCGTWTHFWHLKIETFTSLTASLFSFMSEPVELAPNPKKRVEGPARLMLIH
ncbi:uncharacterized protein LOC100751845 isoform X2 [Cricetulus griseus]|uniref:Uncharacterized protein LOC100751845 isoform X2 n=1 Tax=Cricetulus griseus TaxID=10029 RepID=A0A9J7G2I7_CRIGR|nr:uncharacterized protein LOC100751845 isoform X2 [Cricetulus griseus]XP_027274451.1 uncharacterized protein LOC100751845 isoform X2 [Cricetulus griseus]